MRKIWKRRALERECERSEHEAARLLAALVRSSHEAIHSTSLDGTVTSWNRGAERLYGYSAAEMIGRPLDLLIPPHHRDEHLAILADAATAEGDALELETERMTRDGALIPVELTVSAIRDDAGKIIGLATISRDVTTRKALEAQIEYYSRHDRLTGLYTRHRFVSELRRQLPYTRRYGHRGAVLVLGLDDLGRVQANLGREAGDELVFRTSRVLIDRLRATDTVARVGSDRFAVLLPETSEEDARPIARELVAQVRERFGEYGAPGRPITASAGIVCFENSHPWEAERLIVAATLALERARREGGDRVSLAADPRNVES